jgi:hypothetical protein
MYSPGIHRSRAIRGTEAREHPVSISGGSWGALALLRQRYTHAEPQRLREMPNIGLTQNGVVFSRSLFCVNTGSQVTPSQKMIKVV